MALTNKYVTDAGAGTSDGSSEANAMTWAAMVTEINGGSAAGNVYNVKGAVSRTTTTDSVTSGGSSTSPIVIRGYGTTIGDGYQGRTNGGPLVTTNMPAVTYTTGRLSITGTWIVLESLNVTSAATAATVTLGSDSAAKSCRMDSTGTGGNSNALSISSAARAVAVDNDLSSASATAACLANGNQITRILFNRITSAATGVTVGVGVPTIAFNVFYLCGGVAVSCTATTATPCVFGNTIYGGSSDGIDFVTGTSVLQCVVGNMLTDNGGYGIDLNSAAVGAFLAFNRTRDNTSGAVNLGTDWAAATSYGHVTTDTGGASTDYQNAAGGDFRLLFASPGKGAGGFGVNDIGAQQAPNAGGSTVFIPIGEE